MTLFLLLFPGSFDGPGRSSLSPVQLFHFVMVIISEQDRSLDAITGLTGKHTLVESGRDRIVGAGIDDRVSHNDHGIGAFCVDYERLRIGRLVIVKNIPADDSGYEQGEYDNEG